MSWSLGFDRNHDRDVGYGVPAYCDHPDCTAQIDRGLGYVCCQQEPMGGDEGCGLYFCSAHHDWEGKCERCAVGGDDLPAPFDAKPDHPRWVRQKLEHRSWAEWRAENPREVATLREKYNAAILALPPEAEQWDDDAEDA